MAQDTKIEAHNKKLRNAHDALEKARVSVERRTEALQGANGSRHAELISALSKAQAAEKASQDKYAKVIAAGKDLLKTGSGKVMILMPQGAIDL